MTTNTTRSARKVAAALALMLSISCAPGQLPPIPDFEQLGFADTLEAVREQVLEAHKALEEQPRDAGRNGRLGMLLSVYRRDAAAQILFRRARVLAPDEFRWAYYLAIVLDQLGRYEEAIAEFRAALQIDPDYVEARIQLANLLRQTNEVDESIVHFREITQAHPLRVEGWLGLGKALERAGDYDAATVALERANLLGPQYGEVHYTLATVLRASGDAEGAAREFAAYERTARNTIRVLDPLVLEVLTLHAGDGPYMALADQQLRHGKLAEGVAAFRAALSTNPGNQDAWSGLVNTLARLGQLEQAGQAYREALAAGIAYARLHLTYGRALFEAQQIEAARDVVARAIALDPRYADALATMAEIETQRGSKADAVAYYRRALAARPNDRDLALSLAAALIADGQFPEAAQRLERLVPDPGVKSQLALKELARAYHAMARTDEAIETLRRGRNAAQQSADYAAVKAIDALLAQWGGETGS